MIALAPSCSMWHSVSIHGVTLVEALQCWEGSQETTNRPRQERPSLYPWSTGDSFERGLEDLQGLVEEGEEEEEGETNEIRHSKNPEKEERRRQRSEYSNSFVRQ